MIMRPPAIALATHMWRRTAGIEYAIRYADRESDAGLDGA